MIWSSRPRPRAAGLWATPATSCRRFCWISRAASLCACGPRSGSPDMATYYMSARTCHFGRSLMERALEGGFNFLDAQMATETCTVTCRFQEHLMQKHLDSVKDMDIIQNPDFFCEFTDVPFKKTENSYLHYRQQLQVCAGSPGPELRHRHLRRGPAEGHRAAQRGLPPDHRDRQLPQAGRAHHHGV